VSALLLIGSANAFLHGNAQLSVLVVPVVAGAENKGAAGNDFAVSGVILYARSYSSWCKQRPSISGYLFVSLQINLKRETGF